MAAFTPLRILTFCFSAIFVPPVDADEFTAHNKDPKLSGDCAAAGDFIGAASGTTERIGSTPRTRDGNSTPIDGKRRRCQLIIYLHSPSLFVRMHPRAAKGHAAGSRL